MLLRGGGAGAASELPACQTTAVLDTECIETGVLDSVQGRQWSTVAAVSWLSLCQALCSVCPGPCSVVNNGCSVWTVEF